MRILIAGDVAEARLRLAGALRAARPCIEHATLASAEDAIRHHPPEVLLVIVPDAGGAALVRSFRSADASGAMYVVAVIAASLPARTISSVMAAGCHDVLCAPFSDHEACMRIDGVRRLRRPAITTSITDLRAWQYLGDLVADDLEAAIGRDLTIEAHWPSVVDTCRLASISMTLPADQLELCISLVADDAARRWLSARLLDDAEAPSEHFDDMMRELSNIAGGALKRAASHEGPVLTTGIPVNGRVVPVAGNHSQCWTILLEGDARLSLIGEIYRRTNRRVPAYRLAEGMVVASDIHSRAGVLLLPAGTRLTLTTAQRLSGILGSAPIAVST